MSEPIDDETREWLHSIFGDPVPRDIVPGSGLTREDVIAQNAATGTTRDVVVPGQPIEDADGNIIAMTAPRTEAVTFGGTVITQAQADKFGLTQEEIPNVKIV